MSTLTNLFRRKRSESVVLIDISAGSIAGAHAHYSGNAAPVITYEKRVPIIAHSGEPPADSLMRALVVLNEALVREGIPALARVSGRGRIDTLLVSIGAPWQRTELHEERITDTKPFIFSRKLAVEALKRAARIPAGSTLVDESIISVRLNGYQTRNPYEHRAHRASIAVLVSFVDTELNGRVTRALHNSFHHYRMYAIAGSSLRYQAMRLAFPHERNVIIFDATSSEVAVALVRNGTLVAVSEEPAASEAGDAAWVVSVKMSFAELAAQYPLPQTVFLLAPESVAIAIQQAILSALSGLLWFSDRPPNIVNVRASQLLGPLTQTTGEASDLSLLLMALYWRSHSTSLHPEEEKARGEIDAGVNTHESRE